MGDHPILLFHDRASKLAQKPHYSDFGKGRGCFAVVIITQNNVSKRAFYGSVFILTVVCKVVNYTYLVYIILLAIFCQNMYGPSLFSTLKF